MRCPKCKKKMELMKVKRGDYCDEKGVYGPIYASFVCGDCLIYKEVRLKECE